MSVPYFLSLVFGALIVNDEFTISSPTKRSKNAERKESSGRNQQVGLPKSKLFTKSKYSRHSVAESKVTSSNPSCGTIASGRWRNE